MKVDTKVGDVYSSGLQASGTFAIEQSAKMMHMLSKQIYANNIAAVIRELSTNAYDSHIMAGNPQSFEVHLPTISKPEFFVRDYGTGISPEFIEDMYSRYGYSDKLNNNDVVGCLGLGSKSPLSYSDSFVINSYIDGKEYVYFIAKNEMGIPHWNKVIEQDTTEQNGFKVTVPVQTKDISQFSNEASTIYSYFPNKVVKVLNSKFTIENVYTKDIKEVNGLKYTYYSLINSNTRYSKNSLKIVMGNVCYHTLEHTGVFQDLILFANMGEVDFTISRETLEMTNKTKKFIDESIRTILKNLIEKEEIELKKAKSYFQYKNYPRLGEYKTMCVHGKISAWAYPIPNKQYLPASSNDLFVLCKRTNSIVEECTTPTNIANVESVYYNDCDAKISDIKHTVKSKLSKYSVLLILKEKYDLKEMESYGFCQDDIKPISTILVRKQVRKRIVRKKCSCLNGSDIQLDENSYYYINTTNNIATIGGCSTQSYNISAAYMTYRARLLPHNLTTKLPNQDRIILANTILLRGMCKERNYTEFTAEFTKEYKENTDKILKAEPLAILSLYLDDFKLNMNHLGYFHDPYSTMTKKVFKSKTLQSIQKAIDKKAFYPILKMDNFILTLDFQIEINTVESKRLVDYLRAINRDYQDELMVLLDGDGLYDKLEAEWKSNGIEKFFQ